MRWLWWFLIVPQAFLVVGYLRDLGLPAVDMAVLAALYLAWFAQVPALPFLLLGVAVGRALVDQASLPVHLLVIGVPVAVLLPMRALFVFHLWTFSLIFFRSGSVADALAYMHGLFGRFAWDVGALLNGLSTVEWAAIAGAPVVLVLFELWQGDRGFLPFLGERSFPVRLLLLAGLLFATLLLGPMDAQEFIYFQF